MNLFKFIFLTGARFRNPSLYKHFRDLKSSEHWPLEKLKVQQQNRLLDFITFAGNNSRYYKSLFESIGWVPGNKFTMELFNQIPVTTKNVLISENVAVHSKNITEKTFDCETSGTSGQVLTFRRNENWDSFNRASIMRGYSWYGVHPWNFNLYFWGYNFSGFKKIKLRLMDMMVNRFRIFDYSSKAMKQLVNKIGKTVYIEGYSSMIYELACAAEGTQLDLSKLKLIKGTSEKIYPHYQEKVKQVFGLPIVSEYGAAETGIIAFECKEGNMHINMEGVYVETDSENEILVTNFHSYSFPVIRYKLGDVVKLKSSVDLCACGMAHPIIEEVTGRVGKVVFGKKNKYPSLVFYNIFKNLFFGNGLHVNYQAHQTKVGEVEIRIKEEINSDQEILIQNECNKYFGDDIIVRLVQSTDFRTSGGKLRDFISTLD